MARCRGQLTLWGNWYTMVELSPHWAPQASSQSAGQPVCQCMLETTAQVKATTYTAPVRALPWAEVSDHGVAMRCGAITGTRMQMLSKHSVCGTSSDTLAGSASIVGGAGQLQRQMHRRR